MKQKDESKIIFIVLQLMFSNKAFKNDDCLFLSSVPHHQSQSEYKGLDSQRKINPNQKYSMHSGCWKYLLEKVVYAISIFLKNVLNMYRNMQMQGYILNTMILQIPKRVFDNSNLG